MSFLQVKGIKDYLRVHKIPKYTVEDENKNYFNEVIFTAVLRKKRKLPNNVLPSTKIMFSFCLSGDKKQHEATLQLLKINYETEDGLDVLLESSAVGSSATMQNHFKTALKPKLSLGQQFVCKFL